MKFKFPCIAYAAILPFAGSAFSATTVDDFSGPLAPAYVLTRVND